MNTRSIGKHYRTILDPTLKTYREMMFRDISRITIRYNVLPAKDKIHVINLVKHKVEEGRL